MRRFLAFLMLSLCLAILAVAATIGSGAPSAAIQQSFANAYNRGQFPLLVTLPPLNDVHALGTPGLVQEFSAKAGGTAKFALVKPDPTAPVAQFDTLQIYSDIYTYFTQVGVSAAGYPLADTLACPDNRVGTCNYQLFSKNYVLFVYSTPSVNLTVRDPFYTAWTNNGGISGTPGTVASAESTVTSPSKVQATQQLFDGAAIFSYPVGSAAPTVRSVLEPFTSAFNNGGGIAALGLPTSEALPVTLGGATGLIRQTFEYGRIEQATGGTANVLLALSEVDITYVSLGLNLNAGATATINASTLDLRSTPVYDRVLTWTSTNGAVVKVTGNGYSAVVQAVGGGTANVYATSEGKTSAPLSVRVGSVCCAVGEGAPSAAITQAFQAAVTRNNLSVTLPVSSPVSRQGTGYIQTLTAADGSGTAFVVAQADNSGSAYVLTGSLFAAYVARGGFTGPLGYPASDFLTGGAQKFTSGVALAGNPVRLIPASLAPRWFLLGGAGGPVGLPLDEAVSFSSVSGVGGASQSFASGMLFGLTSGAAAGQAYFSSGLILARYLALAGPSGALGLPSGDVTGVTGSVQSQNFEGGFIDLQPGAAAAVEHFNPRRPAVSVAPALVVPGGRVHISATGFTPGSALTFTITGQAGFSVQSPAGAYAWDVVIPPGTKPATIAVQASAKPGTDAAAASYSITSIPALLPVFSIVSGDQQTGAPGGTLPTPITAVLKDSTGAPIAGAPVTASASPGASLQSNGVTDANGRVAATFRLPASPGVAVGSLTAGGQVVEFSALAAPRSIQAFPVFAQTDAQGGLGASLASLLRFYQNAGLLPIPNGSASPATLGAYLAANNGLAPSETGVLIPNPWVAAQFAAAGLFAETATAGRAVDLIGAGTPVLLVLNVTVDGARGGSVAVDGIGVNADGSLAIADPNPAFARTSLADYLAGFSAQGRTIRGTLAAVLRIGAAQLPPGASPFVIASPLSAAATASSAQTACFPLELSDPAPAGAAGVRYLYCDGTQPAYQLDLTTSKVASVIDLAGGPAAVLPANGTLSWQISRAGGVIGAAAQTLSIASVTDSAAFSSPLSPGGLITVFGSGFTSNSTVTIAGKPAPTVAVFPFQLNALIPAATPVGSTTLQIAGSLGSATKIITISALAPGVFVIGANAQGAIVNLPDGSINSQATPAQRGQFISVYAAGLGATALRNGFQTVNAPVSVVMNAASVPASFAGLLPGFVGLYQINVQIPATLPPTLSGTLALQVGTQSSNVVAFAVQ